MVCSFDFEIRFQSPGKGQAEKKEGPRNLYMVKVAGPSIPQTLDLTLGMVTAISTLMSGRMQVPRR